MKRILITLISFCSIHVFAQTTFQRVIHGSEPSYALCMKQVNGGYIIGGYASLDGYILKIDDLGNVQWNITTGGNGATFFYSVQQTLDGGILGAGYTNAYGVGHEDFYAVKLNSNGVPQWSKTVGGTNFDFCSASAQSRDGGFVLAGKSDSFNNNDDIYIVKLTENGAVIWSRTIGLHISEEVTSIIQTSDGGYALCGFTLTGPVNNYDCYIAKLDSNGVLQWNRTISDEGYGEEYAYSIIQTSDGGYALAGYTNYYGAGNYDFYVCKLDMNGSLQWTRTVGGSSLDEAFSIIQTTDGGYAIAGFTASFGAQYYDCYIVKLDNTGQLQWNKVIGGALIDEAQSILQTPDGGYLVAGYSFVLGGGGILIFKLDSMGNTCGNSFTPQSISGSGGISGIPVPTVNSPSSIVTTPSSIYGTYGTITTLCVTQTLPISNTIPDKYSLSQNYPNPFNPATNIKFSVPQKTFVTITIYNVLGEVVTKLVSEEFSPGTYETNWDASNYPSGVYYYQLTVNSDQFTKYTDTKKMVLIK